MTIEHLIMSSVPPMLVGLYSSMHRQGLGLRHRLLIDWFTFVGTVAMHHVILPTSSLF